ncbi:MAG: hypothetical protein JW888_15980 [Pirellulales bacterium]|nr:hypothetical protein [Pirellulales bacterium]
MMNAVLVSLAMLISGAGPQVETSESPQTRIYVRTIPPGAQIKLDDERLLGPSDGLFLVPSGVRKLTIEMDGYNTEIRHVNAQEGWVTRVELIKLEKSKPAEKPWTSQPLPPPRPASPTKVLSYGDGTAEGERSLGGSGHLIKFDLGKDSAVNQVVGLELFGSRYGDPEPPREDFHVYLLDDKNEVIKELRYPYSKLKREQRWYAFDVPPTTVTSRFSVALSFNPHRTKGFLLGYDTDIDASHSYTGLLARGFATVPKKYDWMVRARMASGRPEAAERFGSRAKVIEEASPSSDSTADPFAAPPPDPQAQALGQAVLRRVAYANRHWLIGPPKAVESYEFTYQMGDDPPKVYRVPDASQARSGLLQGTTFYSPLHEIVRHPESVTVELRSPVSLLNKVIMSPGETIALDYKLDEPIDAAFGNGLEGKWRGYSERRVGEGTLVVDSKTFKILNHRTKGVEQRFSEFAHLGQGSYAPQRIKIVGDSMTFDWDFAIYEPGLWILKEANWERDDESRLPMANLKVTKVNGLEATVRGDTTKAPSSDPF